MEKKYKIIYLLLGIGIGIVITSTLYSFFPVTKYVELSDDIIINRARELGMVTLKESIDIDDKDMNSDDKEDKATEEIEVDEENKDLEDELEDENEDKKKEVEDIDSKDISKVNTKSNDKIEIKKDTKDEVKKANETTPIEDNNVEVIDDEIDVTDNNTESKEEIEAEDIEDAIVETETETDLNAEDDMDKPRKLTIYKGESLKTIASKLFQLELIDNIDKFIFLVKSNGYDKKLRYGEYEIKLNTSYCDIIRILTSD